MCLLWSLMERAFCQCLSILHKYFPESVVLWIGDQKKVNLFREITRKKLVCQFVSVMQFFKMLFWSALLWYLMSLPFIALYLV